MNDIRTRYVCAKVRAGEATNRRPRPPRSGIRVRAPLTLRRSAREAVGVLPEHVGDSRQRQRRSQDGQCAPEEPHENLSLALASAYAAPLVDLTLVASGLGAGCPANR